MEALILQEETGVGKDGYEMMRALLPEGMLPDCRPVRQQRQFLVPQMVPIPGVDDGVVLDSILGNICARVDERLELQKLDEQTQ